MINGKNKGFTLVELMVAIALSSLVISMIAILMGNVSRSYRIANGKISLQMEAQTIMNQLNHMIMEANNVVFSDIDGDSDNDLTIYQKDKGYTITITFDSINHELLFTREKTSGGESSLTKDLFGQYVTGFMVEPLETRGDTFLITLNLELGDNSFSLESKIKVRNKIKR